MFIPIQFIRYPKRETREWSPRRIAAAKKAIRRERDKSPLFPELSRFSNDESIAVKQRQQEIDTYSQDLFGGIRNLHAHHWRKARRELRALPAITRDGIIRYWNISGFPKADPAYLLNIIREERLHARSGWTRLRELRQFQLAGQGRLPRILFAQRLDSLLIRIGMSATIRANTYSRSDWLRRRRQKVQAQHQKQPT